jgi:hypothetical protein
VWTIEELVDQVHSALSAEYPGAPNGRVRDLPDRRAIRWYATTGLVDRPAAMRGRTALYGPRHLLQLVAVKRRQADGRTLAEIQAELTGATDAVLADIARVPEDLLADPDPTDGRGPSTTTEPVRARFWATAPVSPAPHHPAPPLAPSDARPGEPVGAVLSGLLLGGGAVLLLPGRPDTDDHAAIVAAARPLLDVLAARGLLTEIPSEPTHRVPPMDRSPL